MAKITRIKAHDEPPKKEKLQKKKIVEPEEIKEAEVVEEVKAVEENAEVDEIEAKEDVVAEAKAIERVKDNAKVKATAKKKPFILVRPFVAFFQYLRDAWKEIRQVRWPNRKATWKMVLAVLAYTALFVVLISLLDLFFTWLFGLILGNN